MKNRRDYRDSLADIVNAIKDIDDSVEGIDFERVWETIKRDLPLLNETIAKISKET